MTPLFLILALLSFSVPPSLAQTTPPFADMTTSWIGYQEAVTYLMRKGAISGYPDGTFKPRATVNRAEFLKLVFRSRTSGEPASGDCFADVKADDWYAPYVCAAKRRGVVSGYKVGSRYLFKADQPIIFAEAIKMVTLAYGIEVLPPQTGEWFVPYVQKLDDLNVLPESSYIPWQPINRERAADLIARLVRHQEDRTLVHHSAGCNKVVSDGPTMIPINGVNRSYLLTKPQSAFNERASPLIIAFHGRTNSNEQVRNYFGLGREARNMYIAYPAAIQTTGGSFSWADPAAKAPNDLLFFDAMVQQLGERYCIDLHKIYVVGHSLGAYMANGIACARGGVVKASATVGGTYVAKNCTGPTAAMIINNPKDASSPQSAAEAMRDLRIRTNGCGAASESVEPRYLSCSEYSGCPSRPVLFCPHTINTDRNGTYYPHLWPEGTARSMVEFFEGL